MQKNLKTVKTHYEYVFYCLFFLLSFDSLGKEEEKDILDNPRIQSLFNNSYPSKFNYGLGLGGSKHNYLSQAYLKFFELESIFSTSLNITYGENKNFSFGHNYFFALIPYIALAKKVNSKFIPSLSIGAGYLREYSQKNTTAIVSKKINSILSAKLEFHIFLTNRLFMTLQYINNLSINSQKQNERKFAENFGNKSYAGKGFSYFFTVEM